MMKNARLYARLNRWLNTTNIPVPASFRTWLIARLAGAQLVRYRLPEAGFLLDLNLVDSLQSNIYLDQAWERPLSNWLAFFAAKSTVIFDVGTHVGYFTLLMRRYAPPDAQVHAFDPDPRAFEQLEHNVALNNMVVQLNQIAIAADNSTLELHLPHIFRLGSARANQVLAHATDSITVKTVSLDYYCDTAGLTYVDLIKMDIEGGEVNALAGMIAGLHAGRYGALFIELHHSLLTAVQIQIALTHLRAAGYRLFELYPTRLVRADAITSSHLCALSPQAYQALGKPESEFLLPADANVPYSVITAPNTGSGSFGTG